MNLLTLIKKKCFLIQNITAWGEPAVALEKLYRQTAFSNVLQLLLFG